MLDRGLGKQIREHLNIKNPENPENETRAIHVRMDDFLELYRGGIEEDKIYVKEREEAIKLSNLDNQKGKFDYESTETAEDLIPEIMDKILGSDIESYRTTRYDDLKHGVDGYFILESSLNNILAYGLDFTVTRDDNTKTLEKKILYVKNNIEEGHFTTIKYFMSKDFKGEMVNVPRFIFSLKEREVNILKRLHDNRNYENEDFILVSLKFFESLIYQLDVFSEYAGSVKKGGFVVEKYNMIIKLMEDLYEKRQGMVEEKMGTDKFKELKRVASMSVANSPLADVLNDFSKLESRR